jgi:hypothetical protein
VRDKWSAQSFYDAELMIAAENKADRYFMKKAREEAKA